MARLVKKLKAVRCNKRHVCHVIYLRISDILDTSAPPKRYEDDCRKPDNTMLIIIIIITVIAKTAQCLWRTFLKTLRKTTSQPYSKACVFHT